MTANTNPQTNGTRLDAELIFGALRREKQWKVATVSMATLAGVAILAASYVVGSYAPPPPVLVPYDPETGMAVQNAAVEPVSLSEERAIIEASVYRYVVDRETYNQVDNDLRVSRVMAMSNGRARKAMQQLWSSASPNFPPKRYGKDAVVEVNVSSISRISNGRAQIRLNKRLVSPDGVSQGAFTVVLAYTFEPGEEKTLEAVWQNPLGFKVTEYAITSDKLGARP